MSTETTAPPTAATAADPIEAIRAAHAEVIPGPWRWFGLVGSNYELATIDRGRQFVMTFKRLGMNSAQPVFPVRRDGGSLGADDYRDAPGWMTPAKELAVRERPYRDHVERIDHPHAEYLARSWEHVDALLSEIDRLRARVAELEGTR